MTKKIVTIVLVLHSVTSVQQDLSQKCSAWKAFNFSQCPSGMHPFPYFSLIIMIHLRYFLCPFLARL